MRAMPVDPRNLRYGLLLPFPLALYWRDAFRPHALGLLGWRLLTGDGASHRISGLPGCDTVIHTYIHTTNIHTYTHTLEGPGTERPTPRETLLVVCATRSLVSRPDTKTVSRAAAQNSPVPGATISIMPWAGHRASSTYPLIHAVHPTTHPYPLSTHLLVHARSLSRGACVPRARRHRPLVYPIQGQVVKPCTGRPAECLCS